jgi:uncharacterized protein YjbJ (UPF0337 family)
MIAGSKETDMNRDRLEGKWKQLSGRVKEQWGWLTQDRLSVVAGQHDQVAGKYQEQYGVTREESARQLREFLRRNRNWSSTSH